MPDRYQAAVKYFMTKQYPNLINADSTTEDIIEAIDSNRIAVPGIKH